MGQYAPNVLGEIAGVKVGIATDMLLWDHVKKLDYGSLAPEYLTGFGLGFTKGQQYRAELREQPTHLGFDEKVDALIWFFGKFEEGISYHIFNDAVAGYLKHQESWDCKMIDNNTYAKCTDWIEHAQLQRALEGVQKYYEQHFNLQAWREFDRVTTRLSVLRNKKKRKAATEESSKKHQAISSAIMDWLEENKPQ